MVVSRVYPQRCHTHEEQVAAAKVADALPHYTFEGATWCTPTICLSMWRICLKFYPLP